MTSGSEESKSLGLFWWLVVVICGIGTYWRLQGVNPPSLRLDDQWLAILVAKLSVHEFLVLRPPVPAGFAAAQAALAGFAADPEWPLQIIPLVASLVQLPFMALVALRITGRPSLACLATAMLLLNPNIAQYAVTPKHYTVDSLLTVVLLAIGLPLLSRWNTARAVSIALAGLLSPLFSFPSTFVGLAIINSVCFVGAANRDARRRVSVLWVGFHAGLALVYWFLLRTQSNAAMQLYWSDHFLGMDAIATEGSLSSVTPWWAVTGAFPYAIRGVAILAAVGLAAALLQRERRLIGLCFGLFYAGVLLAAALEIYPLGTGRTDIYSYPISILAAVLAVELLFRIPRIQSGVSAAVLAVAAVAMVLLPAVSRYEPGEDSHLAKVLSERARPEDLVVIYPHAEFAIGYYTDWAFVARQSTVYAHGFELEFSRDNTLKLPPPDRSEEYPLVIDSLLAEFLPRGERVYYLATHIFPRGHEFVQSVLEHHGLSPVWVISRPRGQLICYERVGSLSPQQRRR